MSRFLRYEACPRCTSIGKDTRKDNLGVYDDDSKHCYACGYHESPKRAPIKREVIPNAIKALCPGDFTREIPNHAWHWLLQYGLPWSYWEDHCGYSETDERLIFKIGNPSLAFSIGRWTPKHPDEEPYTKRKWYMYGDNKRHCEVVGDKGEYTVLVEDIVSAHKVGQVTTTIPLFGTGINEAIIYYLMTQHKPIKLWQDKDQQLLVYRRAARLQALTNCSVSVIITDKDPKCYSVQDIEGML
jgi:Zn ribbon nucleic-acid-binding protein